MQALISFWPAVTEQGIYSTTYLSTSSIVIDFLTSQDKIRAEVHKWMHPILFTGLKWLGKWFITLRLSFFYFISGHCKIFVTFTLVDRLKAVSENFNAYLFIYLFALLLKSSYSKDLFVWSCTFQAIHWNTFMLCVSVYI